MSTSTSISEEDAEVLSGHDYVMEEYPPGRHYDKDN